jgi:serine/threonine protein kinase
MPSSVEGVVFGRLAAGKGFISDETLYSCLKRCQKSMQSGQEFVSLKDMLVRHEHLTSDQVQEIDEVLQEVEREDRIPGYEIHGRVQDTEYGALYRASQLSLDRKVNIQVLFSLAVRDQDLIDRFDREARALSGLNHRGVIQGIDVGQEEDLWYFVMEYVEGQSLSEYVDQHGTLDGSEALDFTLQTAKAIQALHDHGLEHGDINPDHIMVNQDGITKLTGFPLGSKGQHRLEVEAGIVPSNLHYMSPEYLRNGTLDVQSDLYALGASIYHAVTAHRPFPEMDEGGILERDAGSRPPEPVLVERPEIDSGVSAVIEKLMLADPDYRYQSPDEVIEDVVQISEGQTPEHVNVRDHLSQPQLMRDSGRERRPSYLGSVINVLVEDVRVQTAVAILALFAVVLSYLRFSAQKPVPTAEQTAEGVVNTSSDRKGEGEDADQRKIETSPKGETASQQDEDTSTSETALSDEDKTPTDGSGKQQKDSSSEQGQENEEQADQQQQGGGQAPEQRDPLRNKYRQLKAATDDFQGSVSDVKGLVSRVDDMINETDRQDLTSDLRGLRNTFLSEQAERFLDNQIDILDVEGAEIQRLDKTYQKLNTFPELFRGTSAWKVVQRRKNMVRKEVQDRFKKLKEDLRESIGTSSFSGTDQTLEKLHTIASLKHLSNVAGDWSALRTEYLKKRSAHQRNLVQEELRSLDEFQKTFWKMYDLSEKSILKVSDQEATKQIGIYSRRVKLDTVKNRIQKFGEDINTLRIYRKMLRGNLKKMASADRALEKLVEQPGVEGKLEGVSNGILRVSSQDRTVEQPLSEYRISHRIAFARWERENLTAREAFALGLASFLGGDLTLAKLWLSEAREKVTRAEFYLDEISRRNRSPRERNAQGIFDALKLARNEQLWFALPEILHRLSLYDDTKLFQQNSQLMSQARSQLPYQPDSILDMSSLREQQEQLERMLQLYRAWFEGQVARGADRQTLQITYRFKNRKELTDWSSTNENGLNARYLKSKDAVRLAGEGMFLHNASLTGPVRLQVELQDAEPIIDTGAVLMWRENRGYRGMINWTPLGTSKGYSPMGSTVLQKLQLPRPDKPGFANAQILTMESTSNNGSSQATTDFRLQYGEEVLNLSINDRELVSTSDDQFERGRPGLILEGARKKIKRIQIAGTPDQEWVNRKLESLGKTADQIIAEHSKANQGSKGATSGQAGGTKQEKRSGSETGDEQEQSGSTTDSPLDFQDVKPGEVAFAVNFGGKQISQDGQTFVADSFPDKNRNSKSGTISRRGRGTVPGSLKDVFRSDRFGKDMTFAFPLANGTYTVELFFVEDWWDKPDTRVFDVYLQDQKVIDKLDVYQETGQRHEGLKRTLKGVQVRDRRIELGLEAIKDNANIAGVIIKRVE